MRKARLGAVLAAVMGSLLVAGPAAAVPPAVVTGPVTSSSQTSATVTGSVNPNGLATTWFFQYGTSTSYGSQTASTNAGSGTTSTNVSASLSGLSPGTTYHYRVVATNASGSDKSGDRTFTTATGSSGSPPETTITSGPSGPTGDATPTFRFSSSKANSTFQCRVDDDQFAACTSPYTAPRLGNGSHTFEVRATDSRGRTDPTPATRGFRVDTRAPALEIDSGKVKLTKRGIAKPKLSCPSSERDGPCAGRLKLKTKKKVGFHGHRHKEALGSTRFSIPSGKTRAAKVRLSKSDLKLVEKLGAVKVKAKARVHDSLGNTTKVSQVFKLKSR
jgi:hypothetical protein